MKILGIGNAIVDVICKVDDDFISKKKLTKGSMKLIFDEIEFKELFTNLIIEKNNFWRICSEFNSRFIST